MHLKNLLTISLILASFFVGAQSDYRNLKEISADLKELVASSKGKAQLTSLSTTENGNDIWMLTLSEGVPAANPGIAILGGVDGRYVLSTELSVAVAENILKTNPALLEKTTFYIFPNLSPDATAQYFESLSYERTVNGRTTDNDRDGRIDEDPFEDLNGDGLITVMRVSDPSGTYRALDEDPRVLVAIDPTKNELGTYALHSEGIDNDGDGLFNEDGPGGVAFNSNFTYNFPYFTPEAGEHPISENEHRALLDFLYTQWNVFAVMTFGPANNLSTPLKYNKAQASKRVVSSILEADEKLNTMLSEMYNELISPAGAPDSVQEGGGAFEWSYFHFGRLALSTPGWWPTSAKEDSLTKAPKNKEANFLFKADQEGTSVFVPWTEVKHPDFPDSKVEIGGFKPFVMKNPPYQMVDSLGQKHTQFLIQLAKMQPTLELRNVTSQSLSNNLTRITAQLFNAGRIPTHTAMGEKSRWMRKINVHMKLSKNQELLSGTTRKVINSLGAGEQLEMSWLISGKGTATLKATAPQAGTVQTTIKL